MKQLKTLVLFGVFLLFYSGSSMAQGDPRVDQASLQIEQLLVDLAAPLAGKAAEGGEPNNGRLTINVLPFSLDQIDGCKNFEAYLPSGRQLAAKSVVGLRCVEAGAAATRSSSPPLLVKADVHIESSQYVAKQTIQPNDVITADSIEARSVNLLTQTATTKVLASQLIGRRANQRILAGSIVKLSATRGSHSVRKGESVRVESRTAGLVVATQGEVQSPADVGAAVSVKTSSGKIVQGILSNDGVVLITF